MKTSIKFFIACMFFTATVKSQDLVTLKDGTEIKGKVLELNTDVVKMKKAENPDGPTYSIAKSDVFFITYSNGQKEVLNPISQNSETSYSSTANASEEVPDPRLKYNGPRVGLTMICSGAVADNLSKNGYNPVYSQFGWQFETRIWSVKDGPTGVVEFVPMIAGLDKGLFIPNMSLLIGIRSKAGYEFGLGPNAVLDMQGLGNGSLGLVIAGGMSIKRGKVIFPLNIAVVPSVRKTSEAYIYDPISQQSRMTSVSYDTGIRVSLLIGFNTRTQ